MNAFEQASQVEARGVVRLAPWLEERALGGNVVWTAKGRLSRFLQETIGDAVFQERETGALVAVELKCENRFTGNLFLETWSNRNLEHASDHAMRGSTPGWLCKSKADALLYYFLDSDTLVTCSVLALKRWAFDAPRSSFDDRGYPLVGRIYDYRITRQSRYAQMNDTWGHIVPIEHLRSEIGARKFRVQQLELPELAA